MRKGEIACNQRFFPFLTLFSALYGTYFSFQMHYKMSSAICFNLDQSETLSSVNWLSTRSGAVAHNCSALVEDCKGKS